MSIFRPSQGPGRLPVVKAHRMLQEATAVLPALRETEEWRAGHISGGQHLPLSGLTAGAKVSSAYAGSRLLLVCRSGQRSQHAAHLPGQRGMDAVEVTDGLKAWVRQGLPVQDTVGAAGTVT
ncbi:rhodanese-like domain-containing protein [Streptomyces sp. NPDC058001]|uniref:rhodanese-like domain-containing protein n=1 Tax=Streptomyces sp. NPDC058001 TaxID=3346300 RepID=UPI0036E0C3C9